ncbi:hypothetical protein P152DRAFT_451588 [Eremomyces bilateralis CBS 781.70]|uniref:Nephrocystin 3-like N-terminal domain-containing protein n=1 Tax=Eremomyces bilateralis CBS 781.70 TaxID=1392243 RepID=A0A6G1FW50_9PEZI|nr:uncharacterized protein P152DRAFT_451588 [Eremomyces bilateralis CBS 781.70]KAF1809926.1 hypothetical protein P152DRAFT_451588 [Eremomyces bilateralis CBS 781.70]
MYASPDHQPVRFTNEGGGVRVQAGQNIVYVDFNVHRTTHDHNPLNSLPYAPNAAFNALEKGDDPLCIPGTRVDVLNDIRKWVDGEDKRHIFWLSGWADTGKSTIARTVAREYYGGSRLVASYFFSKGGGDTGNATKFVGTIARQLAGSFPSSRDCSRKPYGIGGRRHCPSRPKGSMTGTHHYTASATCDRLRH